MDWIKRVWDKVLGPAIKRESRSTSSPMTADQRKHFDAAFAKMDEAFAELDKVFAKGRKP
jgi:hypothetical protein